MDSIALELIQIMDVKTSGGQISIFLPDGRWTSRRFFPQYLPEMTIANIHQLTELTELQISSIWPCLTAHESQIRVYVRVGV
jgi:hypothetical protein